MNLKSIYQKVLLWFINLLYYPSKISYYWSAKPNRICIKNYRTEKFRWIGSSVWTSWSNEPSPLHGDIERLTSNMKEVSLKTLWYLFQNDSKIQSRVYFANTFLWLESIDLILRLTTVLFSWPNDNLSPYYIHLSATLFVTAIFTLGDMLIKHITNRKQKENK